MHSRTQEIPALHLPGLRYKTTEKSHVDYSFKPTETLQWIQWCRVPLHKKIVQFTNSVHCKSLRFSSSRNTVVIYITITITWVMKGYRMVIAIDGNRRFFLNFSRNQFWNYQMMVIKFVVVFSHARVWQPSTHTGTCTYDIRMWLLKFCIFGFLRICISYWMLF